MRCWSRDHDQRSSERDDSVPDSECQRLAAAEIPLTARCPCPSEGSAELTHRFWRPLPRVPEPHPAQQAPFELCHARDLAAHPDRAARDRVPLVVHLDARTGVRHLGERGVCGEAAEDFVPGRRCDAPRARTGRVRVDDARGGARGELGVRSAVGEEGEEAAGVVCVPVREDDAGDGRGADLQRGEIANERLGVGPGVEEGEVRRGVSGRAGFLGRRAGGVTWRSRGRRGTVVTINADKPWAPWACDGDGTRVSEYKGVQAEIEDRGCTAAKALQIEDRDSGVRVGRGVLVQVLAHLAREARRQLPKPVQCAWQLTGYEHRTRGDVDAPFDGVVDEEGDDEALDGNEGRR